MFFGAKGGSRPERLCHMNRRVSMGRSTIVRQDFDKTITLKTKEKLNVY